MDRPKVVAMGHSNSGGIGRTKDPLVNFVELERKLDATSREGIVFTIFAIIAVVLIFFCGYN